MESLLPPATRQTRRRKTCVILDMEDYTIPAGLSLNLIYQKIQNALFDSGYRRTEVWAWVNTWSDEMWDEFMGTGFRVFPQTEVVQKKRLEMIMVDLLFWLSESSNVLILSKNHENIEQNHLFSRFCKVLEDRDCYLASAKPEAFINESTIVERSYYLFS
ncbi:PREDICTED: uncharacterized protein LOC104722948 isoform X2 [Camelina sativa]|nr:PREDICTED: uncharacterized protein LOC104722948 isoform X2 [Camelina sativa]